MIPQTDFVTVVSPQARHRLLPPNIARLSTNHLDNSQICVTMPSQIWSSISPDPLQSSHSRWLALKHRTPSSHSSFFYGVISTKIYCRPTCNSRLARRANIVFYDTEEQARREGFRPCKRCKPDDTTFAGDGEEVVIRALALLRTKKDDQGIKRSLKELAQEVGVTPSYLCRVFKRIMGVTIGAYIKEFEREGSEGEIEISVQSLSDEGSVVVDRETGLLTPASTTRSVSAPVEDLTGGQAEKHAATNEEAPDLDFDFNEWFWTEDFCIDSNFTNDPS